MNTPGSATLSAGRERDGAASIPRTLVALVAVAATAVLIVGAVGWVAVSSGASHLNRLRRDQQLMSVHQDADTMQDALRGDVLSAAQGTQPTAPDRAAEDVEVHENRLREDLAAYRRLAADTFGDGSVFSGRVRSVSDRLANYSADAEEIVELVGDDPAVAAGRLTEFEETYRELDGELSGLASTLREEADAVRADAAANADRARLLALVAPVVALVALAVLASTVLLRVRRALAAKAVAEGEMARLAAEAAGESERHLFAAELYAAFELAGSEEAALETVAIGMPGAVDDHPAELLMADSSEAHLDRVVTSPVAEPPCCPVTSGSPWDCPAIRRSTTQVFPRSASISACPELRQHPGGPVSAVCAPVSFMGRPLGVLHVTGPEAVPPDGAAVERINVLAAHAGARIGTLRATQQTELHASTDVLTGLLNRRSLERGVRRLLEAGRPFALAMADLDRFKRLNDTYGHEAGDQALRVFAETTTRTLREGDMVARIGGEEFVLVFPECSTAEAIPLAERLQVRLREGRPNAGLPAFTVSLGIADSSDGGTLAEILRVADRRLRAAKLLGRDRVVAEGAGAAEGAEGGAERDEGVPAEHALANARSVGSRHERPDRTDARREPERPDPE